MRLFKRKKNIQAEPGRLLTGIYKLTSQLQSNWAAWMNKKTAGISSRKWKILLLTFVLLSSGTSVYVAYSALIGYESKSFQIQALNPPLIQKGFREDSEELDSLSSDLGDLSGMHSLWDSLGCPPGDVQSYLRPDTTFLEQ